jgi:23S rRNA (adenine2503-C2)-methyltransferase
VEVLQVAAGGFVEGDCGGEKVKIIRNLEVPTGNICIGEGAKGLLEFLSLGDYGKETNLNQHKAVHHQPIMPLTEKWVVTISTQYGCSMGCEFCDVPKVGPGKNATFFDLTGQILAAIKLHPEITETKRLNVHFARMGEPTWNPNVLECGKWLHTHLNDTFHIHPVVSTMMPKHNEWLRTFIHNWMRMKNRLYNGNAGLQLSINSTDPHERDKMFHNNACSLDQIARIMDGIVPVGRKITLNFAVAEYTIDPEVLMNYFDPALYTIKLTPMHKTSTALKNGVQTVGDYTDFHPYLQHEEALKKIGYEVLTFIASTEEDLGRITCGNAILSGSLPLVEFKEVAIEQS